MNFFFIVLVRQLKISLKNPKQIINQVLTIMICILLFPLAIPDINNLKEIAPAIFSIVILISNLLSFDFFFYQDAQNNVLEQIILTTKSLLSIVYAKILSHWLLTIIPIIILLPIISSWLF